jgi:hypothetical protein
MDRVDRGIDSSSSCAGCRYNNRTFGHYCPHACGKCGGTGWIESREDKLLRILRHACEQHAHTCHCDACRELKQNGFRA